MDKKTILTTVIESKEPKSKCEGWFSNTLFVTQTITTQCQNNLEFFLKYSHHHLVKLKEKLKFLLTDLLQ